MSPALPLSYRPKLILAKYGGFVKGIIPIRLLDNKSYNKTQVAAQCGRAKSPSKFFEIKILGEHPSQPIDSKGRQVRARPASPLL